MNYRLTSNLTPILAMPFILLLFSFNSLLAQTLITVDDDGGKDFTSIQDALDSAEHGDTIFVYNGIYKGSLTIEKGIHLIGESNRATIIDGENGEEAITIGDTGENGGSVQNLRIINTSDEWTNCGLRRRYDSGDWLINGNYFTDHKENAMIISGPSTVITNNILYDNATGIFLTSLSETAIINNVIDGSGQAIFMHSQATSAIAHNNIFLNNNSAFAPNIDDYEFSHNAFQDNNIICSSCEIGDFNIIDQALNFDETSTDYDYLPSSSSPLINAGIEVVTIFDNPTLDFAGEPRIFGSGLDIGALESQSMISSITEKEDEEISIYPNPSSGTIYIEGIETVQGEIWNLQGKKLASFNQRKVEFNRFISGNYMLRIKNPKSNQWTTHQIIHID